MDKGNRVKTVYGLLLVDNTRTYDTARSRMLEFGIESGSSRGGGVSMGTNPMSL